MIHDYYDSGCLMASSAPCCETLPLIVVELGEVEPSLFLFPHVSVLFFSFFFPSDNCVSRRLTGLLLAQLERIFQAFMRTIFAPRFSRGGKKNFIINSKLKALRFSKLCRYALSFEKKKPLLRSLFVPRESMALKLTRMLRVLNHFSLVRAFVREGKPS